jgi:UDP-N-acetylglucosamine--N-acetylmuramyl-(pentapeptide) pyrophosphoryl-undecaprenol N-acetylglucosamine transferase
MVDDANLSAAWIVQTLLPILNDPERVVAMSEAASRMGRKDADMALARKVLEIAHR